MALAWLRYEGDEDGDAVFAFDLGRNRWYRIAAGPAVRQDGGIALLDGPAWESPLEGPLPEHARGRGRLRIPQHRLAGRGMRVQLVSYRDRGLRGMALSDPVAAGAGAPSSDGLPDGIVGPGGIPMPGLSFSASHGPGAQGQGAVPMAISASAAPRRGHRVVRPLSRAQFLDGLLSMLPQVLPALGGLFGGLGGRPASPSPAAAAPDGNIAQIIAQLLQQVLAAAPAGTGPAALRAAVPVPAASAAPVATASSVYSQGMIAPALLAALPALMPLLQNVLSPQTIQSVLQTVDPNRLLGTVTNGLRDLGRLGIDLQRQENDFLRSLVPSTEDAQITQLLQGMSLSLARERGVPRYRRSSEAALDFADVATLVVAGRPRTAYLKGRAFAFPLDVRCNRPIAGATLHLTIKDQATLEVVAARAWDLDRVEPGRLPAPPRLDATAASRLRTDGDYLATVHLVWKGRDGRQLGTSRTHLITVVEPLAFDRVEESGELVPLNDLDRDRAFWHRIWGGDFSSTAKRFAIDVRYSYGIDADLSGTRRLATDEALRREGAFTAAGSLRSGLEIGLYALNALLPRLNRPALGEEELAALRGEAFLRQAGRVARGRVSLQGRRGDAAALWVYPEIKLQRVVLKQASAVDGTGQVRRVEDREVIFPLPSLLHLISTRSRS